MHSMTNGTRKSKRSPFPPIYILPYASDGISRPVPPHLAKSPADEAGVTAQVKYPIRIQKY